MRMFYRSSFFRGLIFLPRLQSVVFTLFGSFPMSGSGVKSLLGKLVVELSTSGYGSTSGNMLGGLTNFAALPMH